MEILSRFKKNKKPQSKYAQQRKDALKLRSSQNQPAGLKDRVFGRFKRKKDARSDIAKQRGADRPGLENPTKRKEKIPRLQDFRVMYTVAAMSGFGLLMVFSASAIIAYSESGNTFDFFLKQIAWLIIGTILSYMAYRIPLPFVEKLSPLIMAVTIVTLIAVFFVGKDLNGARRWIDLGPFDLQPSEIAKLGFTIYLSAWLCRPKTQSKDIRDILRNHLNEELVPFLLLIAIVCFLIVMQPDLDTAVIIALTALTVYFVSGKEAIHTVGSIFIVITMAAVGALAAVAAPYRFGRVQTYLKFLTSGDFSREEKLSTAFQVWNNLIAIGTGGVLGVGFGNSRQKLFYLQNAAFTDSIYSIVAEEFGLVGSVLLIFAFLYFMALGVDIARKAPTPFGAYLALGITTWIVIQAFLNIGANLALIPFGGIPLPFISYGGSGTIITLIAVGLLLNVQHQGELGLPKVRKISV